MPDILINLCRFFYHIHIVCVYSVIVTCCIILKFIPTNFHINSVINAEKKDVKNTKNVFICDFFYITIVFLTLNKYINFNKYFVRFCESTKTLTIWHHYSLYISKFVWVRNIIYCFFFSSKSDTRIKYCPYLSKCREVTLHLKIFVVQRFLVIYSYLWMKPETLKRAVNCTLSNICILCMSDSCISVS